MVHIDSTSSDYALIINAIMTLIIHRIINP